MPPRLMMFELILSDAARHGDQHADRRASQDGDQSAADVQQKDDADQRDDDAFFGQRALEGLDRAMNEIGAVIDRFDADVLRQGRSDVGELLLDAVDHAQRVLPVALQRDPAHDFALAVELGDATALFGSELNRATSRSNTGVPPCILSAISSRSLVLRR